MELMHINIARLCVSGLNMRGNRKAPDLANILPSVRARGILVPLIVREKREGAAEGGEECPAYEIVAGKRRYHAALTLAQENEGIDPLPAVMEAGDDVAALEASLIENIARLDPDEMTQCETFTRLVREGRSVEELSLTFGLTPLQVKRTLALGNLLPRIRNLYRGGKIDAVTVRHLTLASKTQQRDWLALLDHGNAYVPTGSALKAWLFGGVSIPVKAALFDLDGYYGEIVSDLFGEDRYFADVAAFWTAQHAAIEARVGQYRDAGWRDVVLLPQGEPFHGWEYERCPKRKGGKVYVVTSNRGDVAFHEGYLTSKEARKLERQGESGEAIDKPSRPEVTSSQQDYIDLHRHAAVRARMIGHPGLCLRVAVAHMIAGSPLWTVRTEPQRAADAIAESVENSSSEAQFDAERRRLLALLDFDADTPTITGGSDGLTSLYARLCTLDDATVMAILSVVMGETLDARSDLVDALGLQLGIDMAQVWQADDALLDSPRDREVIDAILTEVAGKDIAEANAKETGKTKKQIVRDCLTGSNGRAKVEGWVPRWLRFPASSYTGRGGVASVSRTTSAVEAMALSSDTDAEPQVDPAPMPQAA